MGHRDKYKHERRSRSREKYRSRKKKHYRSDSESSEDNESRHRGRKQRHRSDSSEDSEHSSQGVRKSHKSSQDRRESHKRTQRYNHSDSSQESRSPSDSRERKRKKDKKKKKHRSRSRSPVVRKKKRREKSSESSDTDDDSRDRGKMSRSSRLSQEEVDKMQEEMRRRKEIIKATETPEEKRARRLAKKDAKERKKREKSGWDQEYMGYTNVDNPFGDEHLTETFVWSKKISKEGKEALDHEEIHQMTKKKMEETRIELEKVKKRRLEREREREEREKEREMLQREKESEYYREWEKSEDTFHLQQAKLRSEIRIQDGRAKPIDLLAKYISAEDDELAVEMHEPYTYLYGLTISDLEDLLEDIKVYLELEQGKNTEYWRDIVTVTQDELMKLKKLGSTSDFRDRREGVNEAVNDEVVSVFKGKTTKQLQLLEEQMKKKLEGGEGVDVGYWESLLQQLKAHMAKTRLRERHQEVLRRKLFKLKQEQGIESNPLFPAGVRREGTPTSGRSTPTQRRDSPAPRATTTITGEATSGSSLNQEEAGPSTSGEHAERDEAGEGDDDEPLITEEDLEEEVEDQCVTDYRVGSYSPKLFKPADIDDMDAVIYDPVDDMKKLELARKQVKSTGRVTLDQEAEFVQKAREGMDDEEAQFSVQHELEKQSFLWSDKYRPRKPRFFNRVHTGFEWNKYNQTHYDIDNPPPKIVQGYKFNIFYPDLIDKSKTPEYTITPIPENPDFAILRFHAGPPYEDIAFKIVSKEWEHSYKRSFRCQFANNIMQLWFHFKRERYRR
ncbi:splicing factor Cactin-like [Mercenaria mercenaria]|uniref:splicing factor Cactin-like n=1 Tax=Mercenaria mercenaria TaxID=6596 RepID=UPI00234F6274|nr:splicing factor Cactin-like [Mercenaria mercenaria]